QNFMETRFTNTKRVGNIVYVLTDVKSGKDKGAGLVGVNLMTGQGASQIMFKDKTPDYEVDEAAGRLFNLNKGELVAFSISEKAEMEQNKDGDDDDKEKSKDK
ncbi:MAG TPA: hypothetical protein VEQ34_05125, partial [Pyrinomonadaceae bacterium]|nr:hypothetical protein [Pyrinomonadaceae bacterium]